jgi:5'-3' exonuclease
MKNTQINHQIKSSLDDFNKDMNVHIQNLICQEEQNIGIPDELEEKLYVNVFNYIYNFLINNK